MNFSPINSTPINGDYVAGALPYAGSLTATIDTNTSLYSLDTLYRTLANTISFAGGTIGNITPEDICSATFIAADQANIIKEVHKLLTDGVVFAAGTTYIPAILLQEVITAMEGVAANAISVPVLSEQIRITDAITMARLAILADVVNSTASVVGDRFYLASLIESLVFTGIAASTATAAAIVAEAITIDPSALRFFDAAIVDSISTTSSVSQLAMFLRTLVDEASLDGVSVAIAQFSLVLNTSTTILATLSTNAALVAAITEGVNIAVTLPLLDTTYAGWVMNTKNHASTEYTNFNFNSFCKYENTYLAASSTGLYALGGSDDAGANIAASFLSGSSDLGSTQLKRVERVYLGYRADGELLVKTITNENIERWYKLDSYDTEGGAHEARIKVGKGAKSRYWQFEVTNVNGSDFDIDSFEFTPVVLTRKVRR